MDTWHLATVQQHTAHLHCLLYPIITDSSIVVFDRLDDLGDLLWDLKLGELDKLTQRLVTLNNMNTRKLRSTPVQL